MDERKKKILLVAIPNSIHTARWLNQITNEDEWDVHLFPSIGGEVTHPMITGVVVHHLFYRGHISYGKVEMPSLFAKVFDSLRVHVIDRFFPKHRARQLTRVIGRLKPDVIHSMEMQAGGYLTLEAKTLLKGRFPPWLVTNWGSDIYFFGRLKKHKQKIADVLTNCDFYSCECHRDVILARNFGFSKTVLPVFPNTGGFDLQKLEKLRNEKVTSERKLIMLKGYQNWAGRALVGLHALERCADLLTGYRVAIYSASSDVWMAAELFSEKTGVEICMVPHGTSHTEMLRLHGQARISIGVSISDAISTSLLEAMVMGAFPIQSCTACADEWIEHGVSGMIVPPEDPDIIGKAVRKALTDEDLVNNAASLNWEVAQARLDIELLRRKTVGLYREILQARGSA